MVKEFLKLSLIDEKQLNYNFKRILAITFTNKAAAEMKLRVINSLNDICYAETFPAIGITLVQELNLSESEIKKRAKVVLESILHNYSDLSISTIDSFTHKLVKTFAFDLKLPVNFEVELNVEGFYKLVVSQLINSIGEDAYVSNLLKEFALSKANSNNSWDPEESILDFALMLVKENSENYIKQLRILDADELETTRKEIVNTTKSFNETVVNHANKALQIIKKYNVDENDLLGKSRSIVGFFRAVASKKFELDDFENAKFISAVTEKTILGKSKTPPSIELQEASNQIVEVAIQLHNYFIDNEKIMRLCELLSPHIYPLLLLKKIEDISTTKKNEEQLVFLSEFNKTIFELINNEPTPFIYERIGEKYRHFLLDEFQDTSTLQFQNIIPLLDNSLSNGWYNLIVGDGKQSIYRWRNANVKQFGSLPKLLNQNALSAERENTLTRNYSEKYLDTNYRSTKTVIEFNNSMFDYLSEQVLIDEYKAIYYKHAQKSINQSEGFVTLNDGLIDKELVDETTLQLILSYVENALEKGFTYREICVITRSNKHLARIAEFLNTKQIPVIASESLLIANCIEVNTIINFLKASINSKDVISYTAIVNYLYQSKQIGEVVFYEILNKLSKFTSVFELLIELGFTISKENFVLDNMMDNCITITYVLGLTKTNGLAVRFFLDEVAEYLVNKSSNVIAFLEWWEVRKQKASLLLPETTDAIRIMTIHNSKGLEFPVVIVPYVNWQLYKEDLTFIDIKQSKITLPVALVKTNQKLNSSEYATVYSDEQQAQALDNLNLLYVAFTRAVNNLHIISLQSSGNKHKTVGNWISNFANEKLQTKHPNYFEVGINIAAKTKHSSSSTNDYLLNELEYESTTGVIKIKKSFEAFNSTGEIARQQGITLHTLFSKIIKQDDVEKALEYSFLEGLIKKEEIEFYRNKIHNLINLPELINYFTTDSVKIETEIMCANGEFLRPDRIIFAENKVTILDYKTGKQHSKKYQQQLYKYKNALLQMNYKNIELVLVYVDELVIEKF